jgi:hypothetical protein
VDNPQQLGASGQPHAVPPVRRPPADIVELVMADHRRIRRLCGVLEDAIRWSDDFGPGWMLANAWERLAVLLDGHTRAEEEICYLPMFQRLPLGAESRREAINDHSDIREAIGEAYLQDVGSVPWWRAVRAVLATSIDHLDREECEALAEALPRLTMVRRWELGSQWRAFIGAWRLDAVAQPAGTRQAPRQTLVHPYPSNQA